MARLVARAVRAVRGEIGRGIAVASRTVIGRAEAGARVYAAGHGRARGGQRVAVAVLVRPAGTRHGVPAGGGVAPVVLEILGGRIFRGFGVAAAGIGKPIKGGSA